MRTPVRIPLRDALRLLGAGLAAIAVAALFGCSDTSPLSPAGATPILAANTEGPLAVTRVIGLEPLFGATVNSSTAYDINDLGHVAGSSAAPGGGTHAVIWDATKGGFPEYDLPSLGGLSAAAMAINGTGTVAVGWSYVAGGNEAHAVRWVKLSGGWVAQDLGTLPGGTSSSAFDIADDGSIVGESDTDLGTHSFLWRNGVMTDLAAAEVFEAAAINAVGQVAGMNINGHAMRWTSAGGAKDLGTLGGSASDAEAINGSGEVVGGASTSAEQWHAFLWTPRKGMIDLGTLGGESSEANDVSPTAQVVGDSQTAQGVYHAFAWAKGKILDLGVLPGYDHSYAFGINGKGQVVGQSGGPGGARATVWTIK